MSTVLAAPIIIPRASQSRAYLVPCSVPQSTSLAMIWFFLLHVWPPKFCRHTRRFKQSPGPHSYRSPAPSSSQTALACGAAFECVLFRFRVLISPACWGCLLFVSRLQNRYRLSHSSKTFNDSTPSTTNTAPPDERMASIWRRWNPDGSLPGALASMAKNLPR